MVLTKDIKQLLISFPSLPLFLFFSRLCNPHHLFLFMILYFKCRIIVFFNFKTLSFDNTAPRLSVLGTPNDEIPRFLSFFIKNPQRLLFDCIFVIFCICMKMLQLFKTLLFDNTSGQHYFVLFPILNVGRKLKVPILNVERTLEESEYFLKIRIA